MSQDLVCARVCVFYSYGCFFADVCKVCLLLFVAVDVEDMKKINNSLSVLLTEKQKQEKVSGRALLFLIYLFLNGHSL